MPTKLVVLLAVIAVSLAVIIPATSAGPRYFSTTKIVSNSTTQGGMVFCPAGTSLTGGGTYALPNDSNYTTSSTTYKVTSSYAMPAFTQEGVKYGASWRATAIVITGQYSSSSGWRYHISTYLPRVFAICAS